MEVVTKGVECHLGVVFENPAKERVLLFKREDFKNCEMNPCEGGSTSTVRYKFPYIEDSSDIVRFVGNFFKNCLGIEEGDITLTKSNGLVHHLKSKVLGDVKVHKFASEKFSLDQKDECKSVAICIMHIRLKNEVPIEEELSKSQHCLIGVREYHFSPLSNKNGHGEGSVEYRINHFFSSHKAVLLENEFNKQIFSHMVVNFSEKRPLVTINRIALFVTVAGAATAALFALRRP